jgi:hypothetical protein
MFIHVDTVVLNCSQGMSVQVFLTFSFMTPDLAVSVEKLQCSAYVSATFAFLQKTLTIVSRTRSLLDTT